MFNHARRCKTRENSSRRQGSPERTLYQCSCLVGRCINSSWRHTRLREKRRRYATSSCSLQGCLHAITASKSLYVAADAHYNCKRGRRASQKVISECIGMCIRKCPESAFLRKEPEHPTLFSSCSLFPQQCDWRSSLCIKRGNLIFSSSCEENSLQVH